ncbi:MAG: ABC transporter permease subunit [Propionibacteriaceae bacterium]|jgi:putative spermidine/putrescine transport system permease protein|nr:ABC transporter permease subunit [Propionibacteriaceae bacterium]
MKTSFVPGRATRWIIAVIVGAFVLIPLLATLEYTFRDRTGHSFAHWAAIADPAKASVYKPLWTGLTNSLILAAVTIVIVLVLVAPTMILVNLRFPKLRRVFEFVALLPITIPAIVLVVGLAPVYRVVGHLFGTGAWTLAFAYGILVLPFSTRAIQANIDAISLTTLTEAARSLGASWFGVIWRVLAPNLRGGLLAGSLISVAVVLGEYTLASLLARQNLQTALVIVNQSDAWVAVIFSLLALAFCFLLLLVIGRVGRVGSSRKEQA